MAGELIGANLYVDDEQGTVQQAAGENLAEKD